jgi:hypothetical protein
MDLIPRPLAAPKVSVLCDTRLLARGKFILKDEYTMKYLKNQYFSKFLHILPSIFDSSRHFIRNLCMIFALPKISLYGSGVNQGKPK